MNVNKLSISAALGLAGLLAGAAHADAPATKWYDKVTLGGYVDAYYQQMLGGDGVTVSAPAKRAFDNKANDFNFGGGELTLSSSDDKSKTGYYLDLILGPPADVINAVNYVTPNGFMVGQAYVNKTWGDAKFTFGKFGTIIGTEVTNPLSDANFSRGLVYGLEPVYSTGLKLDYTLPMSMVLTGLIDNGNSVDNAANEGKGYGLMLAYSGIKNLTSSVSYYGAPASKTAAGISYQDFINVLIGFQAMDTLSFNAEYLYNTTIDTNTNIDPTKGPVAFSPKTQAVALYANWTTPMAGLSLLPRVEQVASPDAAVSNYVNNSYTLTLKYADGPLTHFLEFRDDSSNGFNYSDNKPTPTFSQSQMTLTYAAAYGF
jgi:hypothetical protein